MIFVILIGQIFGRVIVSNNTEPSPTSPIPIDPEVDSEAPEIEGLSSEEKAELDAYIQKVVSQRSSKIRQIFDKQLASALHSTKLSFKEIEAYIVANVQSALSSYNHDFTLKTQVKNDILLEKVLSQFQAFETSLNGEKIKGIQKKARLMYEALVSDVKTMFLVKGDELLAKIAANFAEKYDSFLQTVHDLSTNMDVEITDEVDLNFPNIENIIDNALEEHRIFIIDAISNSKLKASNFANSILEMLHTFLSTTNSHKTFEEVKEYLLNIVDQNEISLKADFEVEKERLQSEIKTPIVTYEDSMTESAFRMLSNLSIDFTGILDEVVQNEINDVITKYG